MVTSSIHTASKKLVSFDGGVSLKCAVARPDRYRSLTSSELRGPRIARGAGLSYCAASFGAGAVSVCHRRFNRVLEFDPGQRLVQVEAGISLGELFDFLAPRGFFLATQPGHPSITVGGCIAADVHGKNQFRDGNFFGQVEALALFHPAHGVVALSRTTESALFDLTCGGYGLTGSILSATLRVRPIPDHAIRLEATAVEDLAALPALLRSAALNSDAVYSCHDLSGSARPFGRGVVVHGGFVTDRGIPQTGASHAPPPNSERRCLTSEARGRRHPVLLNGATALLVNFFVRRLQQAKARRAVTLYELLFPLGGAGSRYFDWYGRPGFHECQALIPCAMFARFADELKSRIQQSRTAVPLASAKLFGGRQNLLRFAGDGVCFAINIPRTPESPRFMALLDELVIGLGGIPNIIKDSRLPGSMARRAYPEFELFRKQLLEFDPARLYCSDLSQRLGL